MYPWPTPGEAFRTEDLLDLPSGAHRYEIVEGSLRVEPPCTIAHHAIADEVRSDLKTAAPAGWRAVRQAGIQIGDSLVVPDVTVLLPGTDPMAMFAGPDSVALVVEVESMGSRKHDRFTKPALYAEAGIESYWRVEPTEAGPVAHLYDGASGGHYRHHRSVNPGDSHLVELPYPVQVAPATWHG